MNKALVDKKNFFKNKSSKFYKNRYCSQNNSSLLVTVSKKKLKFSISKFSINYGKLNHVYKLPSLNFNRFYHMSVKCKATIHLFGGVESNDQFVKSFEKYSLLTNCWKYIANMFDRKHFSACAFMKYNLIT